MIRKLLGSDFVGGKLAFGLLVLRVVVGIAFMVHGQGKIGHPFEWMGPEAPIPGIFQALAAVSEFFGGLALILGLLFRLASFGIACTMAVAAGMVHMPQGHPFVAPQGGPSYELAGVYLAIMILFLLSGPGRFSLDAQWFGKK